MNWEPSTNRGSFAAILVLGLCLMLVPASSVFAGISSLSINQAGTLAPGGRQVTVNGTVMCPTPETVQISVNITQFVHDHVVGKSGNTPLGILCTGAVQNWTVMAGSDAPMQTGPASAGADAFACCSTKPFFEHAETTADVKLQ